MQDDVDETEKVTVDSGSGADLDKSTTENDAGSNEQSSVDGSVTSQPNDEQPTEQDNQSQNKKANKKHNRLRPEVIFPKFLRNKLGKAARPVSCLVLLLIVAIVGCGIWASTSNNTTSSSKAVERFQDKIAAFKVLSTMPKKNQINVVPQTTITVNFSQPVNAAKLQGNLFVTPNVPGKFTQGQTSSQVVFTPNIPFAQGTKVQVMLNGTYQSKQGAKLGADYLYGFTTALPQDGVIFQDPGGLYADVSSLQSGQKETYSLQFGSDVPSKINVSLYKSDMGSLLSSLVYSNTTTVGYTYPAFLDLPIDTSTMQLLSSQASLGNNSNFNVNETNGIYLAVATDSAGNQLGHVWVDYSDFGVIARQDDQQIIADAQNFSSSADISTTVQIYNLQNSVNQLNQVTVDGMTTIPTPYSPLADVMVASDGTSQALVPLSILESQGHVRVDQNLSTALSVFGITDRQTYSPTDTVNYAGYVRTNNDAQYAVGGTGPLNLYVAQNQYATPLATFSVTPDANGMFSGSFNIDSSWLQGSVNGQFQIYVQSPDGNSENNSQLADFTVTTQPNTADNIHVVFSKSSYLPTDSIQATITGTDGNGNPLPANTQVDVQAYSEDYFENDPTANLNDFDDIGTQLNTASATVQLNSNGQATYTLPVSSLPSDGNSQDVTVQANLVGATSGSSEGGASAVVHQGNGTLTFGIGRQVVSTSGTVIGRIYANNLDGSPMANATIGYTLNDGSNPSQIYTSGSVTADANGYAVIPLAVPSGVQVGDFLVLNAWTTDAENNKIEAQNNYPVVTPTPTDIYDTSGAALENLDVSGSSGQLTVGQKVNLNINAPAALNAMITMDRGRIYNPQMVQFNQGNNDFSFTVTPDLAPSFTLTINYIENGVYQSEGVQFTVNNPTKQASVTLTPASSSVSANTQTSVQVNVADSSGNPLQTGLIAEVVSENSYNLYNQVVPDMYVSMYPTLPLMTNSSSSLDSIGTGGGGGCGGGGGEFNSFVNPIGTTLLWEPEVQTNSSGNANINFTPTKGQWRVTVYSMDANTVVGSSSTIVTAN